MAGARQRRPKRVAPLAPDELRRQAEERVDKLFADAASAVVSAVPEDTAAIIHELRVHQIELEMQNEELRRAALELGASREKYFALFDLAPLGYITVGDNGIVDVANLTGAQLLGVERRFLVGQSLNAFVFAPDRDAFYLTQRKLWQTGEPQTCELRLQRADGDGHVETDHFWAHLELQPQRSADGEPLRYHLTFTDIHERVLAEEKLRASEEQLACAVEGSGVGLWDWHVQTGAATFNERWAEIAGFTLAELAPLSIETWRGLCHPDDLRRSRELLKQHFSGESPTYDCEARMRHKDGRWIWVLERGKVSQWDGDGRPLRMIGTHLDITRRKQAEEESARALSILESTMESTADGILIADGKGEMVRFNAKFAEIWGLPEAVAASRDDNAALGFVLDQLTTPEVFLQTVRRLYGAADETSFDVLELKDGRVLERYSQPQRVGDAVDGRVWSFRDVTARKQAEEVLGQRNQQLLSLIDELLSKTAALEDANLTISQIAATDDLTGLANRRHFYESLEKAVSLARRHGSPAALVSFDLDGLKQVNDSAGHATGDQVLKTFASLLGDLCRSEDLPGRLGGDEFSLLLPGVDLSGACGLAERVLAAVRSCTELVRHGVTVSGGAAAWSSGDLADDLLRRADEALYAAKRGGGDVVTVGAEERPPARLD